MSRRTNPYWPILFLLLCVGTTPAAPEVHRTADGLVATGDSGEPLWSRTFDYRLFRPLVVDDLVFVTGISGRLLALDRRTGRERWRFQTEDDWLYPPVQAGGRLVVVGRDSGLHGLSPTDGREIWRRPLVQEPTEGPAVAGGRVLQGTFGGVLWAISPKKGKVLWRRRLDSPPLRLVADDELAVMGGYDTWLRAVQVGDGELRWRLRLPGPLESPPLLDDGRVVVLVGTSLLAIDRRSGRLIQRLPASATGERLRFLPETGKNSRLRWVSEETEDGASQLQRDAPDLPQQEE
ncbi:MAG: hypothetical protein D6720_11395 [Gammaproteobacteria bacterium]|nr:MAG: hypothetical protein D6720_11395 [Gammaproteobacteria bacterium]